MRVKSRVQAKGVDFLCPEVEWKQFFVVGCVHNYCFLNFIMFDNYEYDGYVVSKVKETREG